MSGMDDFPGLVRALAVRVLGYLLLASAVVVVVAFNMQQGWADNHLATVQLAQEEGWGLASNSEWVNAYPQPSVPVYLTGAVICLASGFLILEPGLRRVVKRAAKFVVQPSDSQLV